MLNHEFFSLKVLWMKFTKALPECSQTIYDYEKKKLVAYENLANAHQQIL